MRPYLIIIALLLFQTGCTTAKLLTSDQMREAIIANDTRAVRRAMKAGYDLNTEVAYCFPALPFAAAMKRSAVVHEMVIRLPEQASLDRANCMGHTALHFAVMNEDRDLESLLKARGANAEAKDAQGRSPDDFRRAASPLN